MLILLLKGIFIMMVELKIQDWAIMEMLKEKWLLLSELEII